MRIGSVPSLHGPPSSMWSAAEDLRWEAEGRGRLRDRMHDTVPPTNGEGGSDIRPPVWRNQRPEFPRRRRKLPLEGWALLGGVLPTAEQWGGVEEVRRRGVVGGGQGKVREWDGGPAKGGKSTREPDGLGAPTGRGPTVYPVLWLGFAAADCLAYRVPGCSRWCKHVCLPDERRR